MKVVKSVKMKPHKVTSLELFVVNALPATKCLGGTVYPNFKYGCRSTRKS
jgi:hypothetical protein